MTNFTFQYPIITDQALREDMCYHSWATPNATPSANQAHSLMAKVAIGHEAGKRRQSFLWVHSYPAILRSSTDLQAGYKTGSALSRIGNFGSAS
jgi:hypothetical protein